MNPSNSKLGKNAIVIGASMTGLITARVLCDHFERVTILERDSLPEGHLPRKGVPQGQHVHVLFSGGMKVIDGLFPGFSDELAENGSVVCDFARELCWYHAGVWKARPESGLVSYWQTRPFLESNLRRRLTSDTTVEIRGDCAVTQLNTNGDRSRVTGLVARCGDDGSTETLQADLIVDASGRGSQTPKWIESLGYQKPTETSVEVNIGYASRMYEPPDDTTRDWRIMAQYGTPPENKRTGYIFPIEGGRWLVSAVGFLRDHAPTDDQGYLEFARSMERPDFYDAIKDAKPLTPIAAYTFTANRWRHYDRLSRFPAGLLVIGDAISSFNPVYGQGMSAGALQAEQLRLTLQDCRGHGVPKDLHKEFFRKVAKIIEVPWMLATQSDFRYPGTVGKRPLHSKPLNWYLTGVLRLCSGNDRVTKLFYDVLHFTRKPTAFFRPSVLGAVLLQAFGPRDASAAAKQRPGRGS